MGEGAGQAVREHAWSRARKDFVRTANRAMERQVGGGAEMFLDPEFGEWWADGFGLAAEAILVAEERAQLIGQLRVPAEQVVPIRILAETVRFQVAGENSVYLLFAFADGPTGTAHAVTDNVDDIGEVLGDATIPRYVPKPRIRRHLETVPLPGQLPQPALSVPPVKPSPGQKPGSKPKPKPTSATKPSPASSP